jgi:hypothetical protein
MIHHRALCYIITAGRSFAALLYFISSHSISLSLEDFSLLLMFAELLLFACPSACHMGYMHYSRFQVPAGFPSVGGIHLSLISV